MTTTEVGIVPIVGVHAKKNRRAAKGRRAGRYTPKSADTDTLTVRLSDGAEVMVHLSAYDGALSLKQLTETGEPHSDWYAIMGPDSFIGEYNREHQTCGECNFLEYAVGFRAGGYTSC